MLYSEVNGPTYLPPPAGGYEEHLEHIRSLPLVTPPGVFGFHENANLTKAWNGLFRARNSLERLGNRQRFTFNEVGTCENMLNQAPRCYATLPIPTQSLLMLL